MLRRTILCAPLLCAAAAAPWAAPAAAAALPPACAAALDPPTALRTGADILSFPLPPAATMDDCIALCCQTSTCVALSFNSPQPEATAVGGMACAAGGACCMLKGRVPPLNASNPWPGAVRSATLALGAGPGPAPPFAPSTAIASAALAAGAPALWGDGKADGDTWPSAWLADGRTLAWVCDTTHGPMALMELRGDPYAAALSAALVAPDPLPWLALCKDYNASRAEDWGNVKPGGMAEVNGTLFVGVACISYGFDSTLFVRQHNLAGFVAASSDGGATWGNVTAVDSFPGSFAAPVFTSCGRGAPCPDPDVPGLAWTYVFFTGSSFARAFSYWENGDAHYLARVAPTADAIARPAAYQYYAGTSGGATPRAQWSPDATQAQPVLAFGRMLGQNDVHYNAQIGRWVVANYGFLDAAGNPSPWHQQPWHTKDTPRRTQLTMLEAPQPWGPWRAFFRDDDFGGPWNGSGAYGTTFPAAYHTPVVNGSAQMSMLFSCGNGAAGCFYQLNYINVTLQLSPEGVEHAARVRGRGA
jgi:hypothetical protein